MPAYDGSHHVTLRVVYEDEHLIQIEVRVVTADWAGAAPAYTGRDQIGDFATRLSRFHERLEGDCRFEAGREVSRVSLRFYTYDAARHIACRIELATETWHDQRPEEVFSLALEVKTEPSFLGRFLRDLNDMANEGAEEATLVTE